MHPPLLLFPTSEGDDHRQSPGTHADVGPDDPRRIELLVDDQLFDTRRVTPIGAGPVRIDQAGMDQGGALVARPKRGDARDEIVELGPHTVCLGGQIGDERASYPPPGEGEHGTVETVCCRGAARAVVAGPVGLVLAQVLVTTARTDKARDTTEQLTGGQRPLEVQVGIVFPGEPDPSQDLDAVLGHVDRCVQGDGAGSGGGECALVPGRGARPSRIRGPRRSRHRQSRVQRKGCIPRQSGHLLATDHHVGQTVFHRLELPDGTAELTTDLGVLGGRLETPPDDPGELGSGQRQGQLRHLPGVDRMKLAIDGDVDGRVCLQDTDAAGGIEALERPSSEGPAPGPCSRPHPVHDVEHAPEQVVVGARTVTDDANGDEGHRGHLGADHRAEPTRYLKGALLVRYDAVEVAGPQGDGGCAGTGSERDQHPSQGLGIGGRGFDASRRGQDRSDESRGQHWTRHHGPATLLEHDRQLEQPVALTPESLGHMDPEPTLGGELLPHRLQDFVRDVEQRPGR